MQWELELYEKYKNNTYIIYRNTVYRKKDTGREIYAEKVVKLEYDKQKIFQFFVTI